MREYKYTCLFCKKENIKKVRNKLSKYNKLPIFCNRKCKDLASRLEHNILDCRPKHYNKNSIHKYGRLVALRNYPNKCENCEYDEYIKILEVHHIDENKKNNRLENLIILCPNCHSLLTLKIAKLENRKIFF